MVDAATQLRELSRGVDEILVPQGLEKKLRRSVETGKPLLVKAGFDPTAPDLHLGHTVVMQKMAQFQRFGHDIVFLIGDFTGLVGDPSGKSKTRPQLTPEQVQENAETYKAQVFKILDPEKTQIRFNSEWLGKITPFDFVRLTGQTSVARMLERDDFSKRYKAGQTISLHEFMYPLLQAQDSVALKADVELGGTDQKFNLLLGRQLMENAGLEPQVCITMPLLEGLDGVQKMGKSLGNYVGVDEVPTEMFGKMMRVPDSILKKYYELLSLSSLEDIEALFQKLEAGSAHPKAVKVRLAKEIVARYHSSEAADHAEDQFEKVFSQKQAPDEMPDVDYAHPNGEPLWVPDLLRHAGMVKSTSEGKRLQKQGAVKVEGTPLKEEHWTPAADSFVLQCGKRRFARIRLVPAS